MNHCLDLTTLAANAALPPDPLRQMLSHLSCSACGSDITPFGMVVLIEEGSTQLRGIVCACPECIPLIDDPPALQARIDQFRLLRESGNAVPC